MPSSLSNTERLRSAAAKLRNLAEMATPGPWSFGGGMVGLGIRRLAPGEYAFTAAIADLVDEDDRDNYRASEVRMGDEANDGEWMATMHPGLAGPLANWLDDTADDIDATFGRIETSCQQYAVEVASLILGRDA